MNCALWRELASARVDDALTSEEARALEVHQLLCRTCAEQDHELRALKSLLANAAPLPPDVAYGQELLTHVRSQREGILVQAARATVLPIARWCFVGRGRLPRLTAAALLLALMVVNAPPDRAATQASVESAQAAVSDSVGPAPITAEAPHDLGMLTVWESSADTIVTSIDPSGLAGYEAVTTVPRVLPRPRAGAPAVAPEVRIFLYERIKVRG